MPLGLRKEYYIDRNPNGGLDHLTHARSMLSQVYYRQNMYVMAAQYCDASDLNYYMGPMIAATGAASFLGFVASSSLFAENLFLRSMVSLVSGFLAVMSTTIITIRNTAKFDVKAEMFRGAAGQYRLMATRLEERIRTHRMAMLSEAWKEDKVRQVEMETFNKFFVDNYEVILTAQGEMKYFPPAVAVAAWKKGKVMLPSEIDQPEVGRSDMNQLMDEFL